MKKIIINFKDEDELLSILEKIRWKIAKGELYDYNYQWKILAEASQ